MRRQFASVSPVQYDAGRGAPASSALSRGHSPTRHQYIPHTYSRQPMTWRT